METCDARPGAWICSWKFLESAGKLLQDHPQHPDSATLHEALVYRAEIYARLASAPEDVGVGAGAYLQHEDEQRHENQEKIKQSLEKVGRNG